MRKLINKASAMGIGICTLNNRPALYIQEGQCCRIFATFLSEEKAEMFLRKLKRWDAAGGNDGGSE